MQDYGNFPQWCVLIQICLLICCKKTLQALNKSYKDDIFINIDIYLVYQKF